ncbi:unnamed protein product, partial [Mesorhabditis belari]|uniref:W02B3.4-like N-terminal domain-containing protein n=1 Tax=Mesorhabditis belari TaxID=2138241 RepID=A0AAF3F2G4_9BILA
MLTLVNRRLRISNDSNLRGERKLVKCHRILYDLNVTSGFYVIDIDFLTELHTNCATQPKSPLIMMLDKNLGHTLDKELFNRFQILPYENSSKKDYVQVQDGNVFRLLPKSISYLQIGAIHIPANIPQFLQFWKRSRRVDCKNVLARDEEELENRTIPLNGIKAIASVRDIFLSFGAFPFIHGGSLLGWYRECSLIPHTYDADFGVRIDEMSPSIQYYLRTLPKAADFALYRALGMLSDGYELTIYSWDFFFSIDIFGIYDEGDKSWCGGTSETLQKFRYYYPKIDDFCSADLLDHHFFIPCNVEGVLEAEYGKEWAKDFHTKAYGWSSSAKNVKHVGQWPAELKKDVYQIFLE